MKVAIDSDQNGEALKVALLDYLIERQFEVVNLDFITSNQDKDYPDVAFNMAESILRNEYGKGILICGTGLGMAICANKVKGIYAGACSDVYAAERLAKSNNAQIITIGSQVVGVESAKVLVETFLNSEFQGGKSQAKVDRIIAFENLI
jgi:ribose 5-phosphate isomerase B